MDDTMGNLMFFPHHIPCQAVLQQKSLTALSQLEQAEETRDAKERRRRSRVQMKSRMLFRTKNICRKVFFYFFIYPSYTLVVLHHSP